jgi:formylglycine-generating enzyme required for sulfatase activity
MSPEQARGLDLDAHSDLYSMGLVLYQMATGTLPFTADDAASLMYMHVHEVPEPPDIRNPKVPAWLRDIILKCLAKKPEDRFSHARELRLALAEHKAPELTEKTIVQKGRASGSSRKVLYIAAAAVFFAAVAGWFVLDSRKEKETVVRDMSQPGAPVTQEPSPTMQAAQPQVSADDLAYQQAEMINTKQAYTTYLDKYPQGSHIDGAREKIAAFDEEERLLREQKEAEERLSAAEKQRLAEQRKAEEAERQVEAARKDDEAFAQALGAGTIQALTTYIQSFPAGRHVDEARSSIANLNARSAEEAKKLAAGEVKRDDDAFGIAAKTGSKDAYSTYLISFPAGRHASEAKSAIARIDEREAINDKIRVDLTALSINLLPIPSGTFRMGAEDGDADEKPVRTVTISAFSMSATEVTQGQYKTVMNDNPSFHKLDDNCPVERVIWKEAATFCNRLSERLGLEACYDIASGRCDMSKDGFRLPTEAEWEYACRAGTGTEYNTGAGESALARAGWYQRNSAEKTYAVGLKAVNAWGLFDMHGNVWEWTNDFYSRKSYATDTNTDNPTGVTGGSTRVLRGGSWLDNPKDCRSSKRREYDPEKRYSDIGFRIVRRQ